MVKAIRFTFIFTFFLVATGLLWSQQKVVATNAWTAAFAYFAGATDVIVLAPYEMKHPPEYEISLEELSMIGNTDILVYAGYEAMMNRIMQSMGKETNTLLLQIKTGYSLSIIKKAVYQIASVLGTEEIAVSNLIALEKFFESWRRDLKFYQPVLNNSLVHFHQQGLVKTLGIETEMVFGPAPPSLKQIQDVIDLKPALIIDNHHSPIAAPFLELEPTPKIVEWINFPGTDDTISLMDVLNYNRSQLATVLEQ